jgi:hypothetical protein
MLRCPNPSGMIRVRKCLNQGRDVPPPLIPPRHVGSPRRAERCTAFARAAALTFAVLLTAVGARAEERKSTPYPAVGDVPPRPDKPAMSVDEISKLKNELGAARDRQAPKGKPGESAKHSKH